MASTSNKSERGKEHLRREEYLLPETKSGLKALLSEIIDSEGAVERIVVEAEQPVRVFRWSNVNPMDEPELDLDGAMRNSEMLEYINDGKSAFEAVWDMLHILHKEGMFPVCWAVGLQKKCLLEDWFEVATRGRQAGIENMLHIEVIEASALPEDALILCGATFRDASIKDIKTTIKTAIELKGGEIEHVRSAAPDSGGPGAGERAEAVRAVEAARPGREGEDWSPNRYLTWRMGANRHLRDGAGVLDS